MADRRDSKNDFWILFTDNTPLHKSLSENYFSTKRIIPVLKHIRRISLHAISVLSTKSDNFIEGNKCSICEKCKIM